MGHSAGGHLVALVALQGTGHAERLAVTDDIKVGVCENDVVNFSMCQLPHSLVDTPSSKHRFLCLLDVILFVCTTPLYCPVW